MAILKTKALILNKVPYSNTSLILTAITPNQGKVSLLAKGGRDLRKLRKNNKFDLPDRLTYCTIVYYESRGELHTLSECAAEYGFPSIRDNLDSWKVGFNLIDLLTLSSYHRADSFDLFSLGLYVSYELDSGTDPGVVSIYLLYYYLSCQGVLPEFFRCARSGERLLGAEPVLWSPMTSSAYKKGRAPISEATDTIDAGTWDLFYEIVVNKGNLGAIHVDRPKLKVLRGLLEEQVFLFLSYIPRTFKIEAKPAYL